MQEVKTSARLAAEARKLGFEVTTGVGKTGVVAVMRNGPGPGASDARRHGRPAGGRADRPALRQQGQGDQRLRHRERSHARLRPRHPYGRLAGHGPADGGDEGPMVGDPGDDPPARRGDRRGRQGDARRRPVHPLPKADPCAGLARQRFASGGRAGDHRRARLRQCRQRRHRGEGRRRPRRGAPEHARPDRSRQPDRRHPPDPGQPRARSAGRGGGDGGQLPGRHQAQHHLRRGEAAPDGAQLQPEDPAGAARRDPAHRPGRGDRSRNARGQDAGGDDPGGRVHARRDQHRETQRRHRRPLPRTASAPTGCGPFRRRWWARISAATTSPTRISRA